MGAFLVGTEGESDDPEGVRHGGTDFLKGRGRRVGDVRFDGVVQEMYQG